MRLCALQWSTVGPFSCVKVVIFHSVWGNTVNEIDVSKTTVFRKTTFSMVVPEVVKVMRSEPHRESVVLFGVTVLYNHPSYLASVLSALLLSVSFHLLIFCCQAGRVLCAANLPGSSPARVQRPCASRWLLITFTS